MPFGLKNAPAVFQSFVEIVLAPIKDFAVCYIDDILVFSDSYEEHVQHLYKLLDRLQEYGLILNVEKSKFFQTTVQFLGLELSESGFRPPIDYLPKIENFTRPTTKKGVQSF